MWVRHAQVPWVYFSEQGNGFSLYDERTGEQARAWSAEEAHRWALSRSATPGSHNLGSRFARVAKPIAGALGLDPGCLPCAEREAMLNMIGRRR